MIKYKKELWVKEMFSYAINTKVSFEGLYEKLNEMEVEISSNYYKKVYLPSIPYIVIVQKRWRRNKLLERFRELIHQLVLINRMVEKIDKLEKMKGFAIFEDKLAKM
jgi:hypothetical protein